MCDILKRGMDYIEIRPKMYILFSLYYLKQFIRDEGHPMSKRNCKVFT